MNRAPDALVVLRATSSAFEAHAIRAALEDAGIAALVVETGYFGDPTRPLGAAEVRVAEGDRVEAEEVLAGHARAAGDELGNSTRSPMRMPWPARIGFAAAVLVILVTIAVVIVAALLRVRALA